MSLQNCTGSPFSGGNNGGTSRQRLLELSHGLGALRHYNDLANHVLSLNQQGAVVTKLLGKCIDKSKRTLAPLFYPKKTPHFSQHVPSCYFLIHHLAAIIINNNGIKEMSRGKKRTRIRYRSRRTRPTSNGRQALTELKASLVRFLSGLRNAPANE